MNCRICNHSHGHTHAQPREMMFGWRESFEYFACGQCGALQIARIPDDLGRYYGDGYYSFKPTRDKTLAPWMAWLRHKRSCHHLGQTSLVGALLARFSRRAGYFDWLRPFGITLSSAIVDVGCGSGGLLLKLRREGFENLLGVDPFLPTPIDHGQGLRIITTPLEQLDQTFDLIMLHHSLEHMPDQHASMEAIKARLNRHGGVLIRIPVSNSYAHRRYGIHWSSWDPPRHLYLHTMHSMHLLAAQHGFEIFHLYCDSGSEGIIGSEYFLRDIPRVGWPVGRPPEETPFDRATRSAVDDLVVELNRTLDGDTACFFLRIKT
ncbi:MAG: class I SAM-dependent methyltransferase [Magnetococcus sp. YQC-9]